MKKYLAWSLLIISISMSLCGEQKTETPALDLTSKAKDFVAMLAQEDYAGVVATFDTKMKSVMPESKVAEAWTSIQSQVGMFKKQTGVRQTKEQGFDVVYVTCEFEQRKVDIKVVYNSSQQVSGLWFQ